MIKPVNSKQTQLTVVLNTVQIIAIKSIQTMGAIDLLILGLASWLFPLPKIIAWYDRVYKPSIFHLLKKKIGK